MYGSLVIGKLELFYLYLSFFLRPTKFVLFLLLCLGDGSTVAFPYLNVTKPGIKGTLEFGKKKNHISTFFLFVP